MASELNACVRAYVRVRALMCINFTSQHSLSYHLIVRQAISGEGNSNCSLKSFLLNTFVLRFLISDKDLSRSRSAKAVSENYF